MVISEERQALIQGLHDCACDPREREKHPGRIRGNPTGVTAQGDLASGSWAASPTVSTRRDAHLAFCHIVLPNLVFSANGPAFMRELLGPGNGRRALAGHWNRITGNDRSLRTRRKDFAVSTIRSKEELEAMGFTDRHLSPVDGSVQPRWSVVTITPPPALEQAEVHVIGLLIDWSHIDHLRNLRTPLAEAAASGASGVRYFCLERGASPEMTFMGEWCHPCPPGVRRNLGPGPAPSVETMAKFLSDLVFLDFQAKTSHKPSGKQSVATDAQPAARRPAMHGWLPILSGGKSYNNPFYTPDPSAELPRERGGMRPTPRSHGLGQMRQEALELASRGLAYCYHCPIQVAPSDRTGRLSFQERYGVKVRYFNPNPRPHRSGRIRRQFGPLWEEVKCAECGKPVAFPIKEAMEEQEHFLRRVDAVGRRVFSK